MPETSAPSLAQSFVATLLAALTISVGILAFGGVDAVPVLIVLAMVPAAVVAMLGGQRWADLEEGLVDGMQLALKALAILMVVGAAIAAWASSGTIAAMIDYGLRFISPSWFLPAAVIVSSVVSLSIGSSWATVATVGVALLGVGGALGIEPGLSAGAVISGSYFGDKMSPLSDTTNLAPGIAGAELFDHIQAMLYTTLPAYGIALLIFTAIGLSGSTDAAAFDTSGVVTLQAALHAGQNLSIWLLLPPVLVIGLALLRVPALPVLFIATAVGAIEAALFQGQSAGDLLVQLYEGYASATGDAQVDKLLSRGGMASMSYTISLVLSATALGGLLETAGFIEVLLRALLARVQSTAGLIISTLVAAVGVNMLLAEQYLAIVVPGRMFRDAYAERGLQPRMLSRTIEDSATVTSPLVPWNSCGAYMSAALGVSTFTYAPYAFFNLVMPVVSGVFALLGLFILRRGDEGDG